MTANRVRQPHQLNTSQRNVHLIEIKYCEDTRPEQQLEAAQKQHADLYNLKNVSGRVFKAHTILLGVGGTCYTEHTLKQLQVVTTGRAIENKNTSCSQLHGGGDSRLF
eukprot:1162028-Pelagomonas_calceolata.AAC.8